MRDQSHKINDVYYTNLKVSYKSYECNRDNILLWVSDMYDYSTLSLSLALPLTLRLELTSHTRDTI